MGKTKTKTTPFYINLEEPERKKGQPPFYIRDYYVENNFYFNGSLKKATSFYKNHYYPGNLEQRMGNKKHPFKIVEPKPIPRVDSWKENPEDMIFNQSKGIITLPIHRFYELPGNTHPIDFFNMKAKRCYQGEEVRKHFIHYINYFEKFYDTEHYLYLYYCRLKYVVDYFPGYTKENLFNDIFTYVFNPVMLTKIKYMNEYNYMLPLNNKKKAGSPALQYTEHHAKILMYVSLMMKFTIPIVTHFITTRGYVNQQVNEVLMEYYTRIINLFTSVDIISKLLETVSSSVKHSVKAHSLWNMQNIRGTNTTTHSLESVENIPLQLMPKYTYDQHIISFNFSSIRKNIGYKVIDISYGYNFIPFSSSQRDEDNNSKIDKFEATLEKSDESLHQFIKANKTIGMKELVDSSGVGPITKEEIEFYRKRLSKDGKRVINPLQQKLVNYAMDKYFGDTISSKFTNETEYIIMMIAAKRLLSKKLTIMPYILGGRVVKTVERKTVNKKEMESLKLSKSWREIEQLYHNPELELKIMSDVAVITGSEFEFIDYNDPEVDGRMIEFPSRMVGEDYLKFLLVINNDEDGLNNDCI